MYNVQYMYINYTYKYVLCIYNLQYMYMYINYTYKYVLCIMYSTCILTTCTYTSMCYVYNQEPMKTP